MTQPTKNLNETYRFSRDYELLYRLLHDGHRIAGFIDYDGFGPDNISRDVIAMRYYEDDDRFQIGSRGIGYEPWDKKITVQQFTAYCTKCNIEFIAPTAIEENDLHNKVEWCIDKIMELNPGLQSA